MNNCPDGKCNVAARIAAARAGKARGTGPSTLLGTGATIPMEQRDARNYMPKLPSAQSSFGIGAIAAVVLVIIIMSGKK